MHTSVKPNAHFCHDSRPSRIRPLQNLKERSFNTFLLSFDLSQVHPTDFYPFSNQEQFCTHFSPLVCATRLAYLIVIVSAILTMDLFGEQRSLYNSVCKVTSYVFHNQRFWTRVWASLSNFSSILSGHEMLWGPPSSLPIQLTLRIASWP